MENKFKEIDNLLNNNKIVLFMKGNKQFPQCGFSATVVNILMKCDVEFIAVNILEDAEMREAIKQYSDWPTIPQLYINKEFIGGCDITKELYENGELQKIISAI